jgi:SRSO17 transposase
VGRLQADSRQRRGYRRGRGRSGLGRRRCRLGANPTFLQGLEARRVASLVGISRTFGVRLPAEVHAPLVPPPRPRGRGQPKKPRPAPLYTAQAVREALSADRWQPITWREHDDGVLGKQCVAVWVHWATGGPPCSTSHHRVSTGPEGWLLGERPLPGDSGDRKWYFSTRPADTPLHRLVELAHSRWPIEQFYEDTKGECGLDHYQGRRWDGRHRHPALVMLVYSFLARQRWMPANAAGFPPSGERPSLPVAHRQMLLWLFHDVVLWLMATNHIAQFRPRRI